MDLEKRVKELEAKWDKLTHKQLTRPLDLESAQVVREVIFAGENATDHTTLITTPSITAGVNLLKQPTSYIKMRTGNKDVVVPYYTP